MSSRLELILKIINFIFDWQRSNRSIAEKELAYKLIVISLSAEDLSLKELQDYFSTKQTIILNLINGLKKEKYITESTGSDGIIKYRLLDAGKKLVKQSDNDSDKILKQLSFRFTKQELNKLTLYIDTIVDKAGIKKQPKRKEHQLRPSQRRLAVLLGVIGGTIINTGITSTQLHFFREIFLGHGMIGIEDLIERLGLPSLTVNKLISEYEQLGYLIKRRDVNDKGKKYLALTSNGKILYNKIFLKILNHLIPSFEDLPHYDLEEFLELFTKFTSNKIEIFKIRKTSEGRALLVENLIENGNLLHLSENILSKNQDAYEIIINQVDHIYVQVTKLPNHNVVDLVSWKDTPSINQIRIALAEIMKIYSKKGEMEITFPPLQGIFL